MSKPKGGRGLKAPYQTGVMRVPLPIKDEVQTIVDQWRENYLNLQPIELSSKTSIDYLDVIVLLEEALTLKANAGGKIKDKIRQALLLLKGNN